MAVQNGVVSLTAVATRCCSWNNLCAELNQKKQNSQLQQFFMRHSLSNLLIGAVVGIIYSQNLIKKSVILSYSKACLRLYFLLFVDTFKFIHIKWLLVFKHTVGGTAQLISYGANSDFTTLLLDHTMEPTVLKLI